MPRISPIWPTKISSSVSSAAALPAPIRRCSIPALAVPLPVANCSSCRRSRPPGKPGARSFPIRKPQCRKPAGTPLAAGGCSIQSNSISAIPIFRRKLATTAAKTLVASRQWAIARILRRGRAGQRGPPICGICRRGNGQPLEYSRSRGRRLPGKAPSCSKYPPITRCGSPGRCTRLCKSRSGTAKACWQAPPPSPSMAMEYCSVILFWARTSPIPSTPLP